MDRGTLPRLHVIVGDDIIAAGPGQGPLPSVLAAGRDEVALHVRGRTTCARDLHRFTCWLVEQAADGGTTVLVNDRLDVALAARAPGVHLREDSLPTPVVREIGGSGLLVGRSIHGPGQVDEPAGALPDFFILGAVYPTRSHPGRSPLGIERFSATVARGTVPVFGIGGITPERIPSIVAAGGAGAVVRSGVWGADDPAAAVLRYLEVLSTEYGQ